MRPLTIFNTLQPTIWSPFDQSLYLSLLIRRSTNLSLSTDTRSSYVNYSIHTQGPRAPCLSTSQPFHLSTCICLSSYLPTHLSVGLLVFLPQSPIYISFFVSYIWLSGQHLSVLTESESLLNDVANNVAYVNINPVSDQWKSSSIMHHKSCL